MLPFFELIECLKMTRNIDLAFECGNFEVLKYKKY